MGNPNSLLASSCSPITAAMSAHSNRYSCSIISSTKAGSSVILCHTVVEQRYTHLRPRYGADFGPQVCITEDLRGYCRSGGLTLVGYSVLLQGAYTRSDRPVPAQYAGPDADLRLAALRQVAREVGADANQVVIAWMRQSDPPVLPIVAGSRTEQLRQNIAALEIRLNEDQMQRLNTAGDPEIKKAWLR